MKKTPVFLLLVLVLAVLTACGREENPIDPSERTFLSTILEIQGTTVMVQPAAGSDILNSGDKVSFDIGDLDSLDVEVGDAVEVTYTGNVMETYPVQIHAKSWKPVYDLRTMEYTGQWLDKSQAEDWSGGLLNPIRITRIYSNCFFARPVIPMPYEIKLNGVLSDEWCVGDQITCTYENAYYDPANSRGEADVLTVEASDWRPDPNVAYKPVIYLYPTAETEVTVDLTLNGRLTCTYPAYHDGWHVTASPDGTLTDERGQTYNYLYWEGELNTRYDFSEGFCVKGDETAAFLEDALEQLGLTRREANEFIVFWLPLMERNPYNVIAFQTEAYTAAARLEVAPAPETVIRVFMAWHAADGFTEIPAQKLSAPDRIGFTVVEWGGAETR